MNVKKGFNQGKCPFNKNGIPIKIVIDKVSIDLSLEKAKDLVYQLVYMGEYDIRCDIKNELIFKLETAIGEQGMIELKYRYFGHV